MSTNTLQRSQKWVEAHLKALWVLALITIIVWGIALRFITATAFDLQNDEYYHVNSAKGYRETNQYVLWDWQKNASTQTPYIRAQAYTWQVAISQSLFGEGLLAQRLPAVLWGSLFILLTAILGYLVFKNWMYTTILTALVAWSDGFLWSSVYSRMYSMFTVLTIIPIGFFYLAVRRERISTVPRTDALARIGLYIAAVFFTLFLRPIHDVVLLLIPAMTVTACILWILQKNIPAMWITIISSTAGILALAIHFIHPFLPLEFITIRSSIGYQYLAYPFTNMRFPLIGELLVIGALLSMLYMTYVRRHAIPTWLLTSAGIAGSILIYFTFFSNRYGAYKYAMFIYLFVFLVLVYGWKQLSIMLGEKPFWAYGLSGIICISLLCVPSYPRLHIPAVTGQAMADKSYSELKYENYSAGYSDVLRIARPDDTLIMLLPRTYYLQGVTQTIIPLPLQKTLTVDGMQALLASNPHAIVVWGRYKKDLHITNDVEKYIKKNLKKLDLPNADKTIEAYQLGAQ